MIAFVMRRDDTLREELLERQSELDALSELLDLALAGHGSVALIHGPAGIGKSRVLDAFAAEAAGEESECYGPVATNW